MSTRGDNPVIIQEITSFFIESYSIIPKPKMWEHILLKKQNFYLSEGTYFLYYNHFVMHLFIVFF